MSDNGKKIASLNDAMRANPNAYGRVMVTAGVSHNGPAFIAKALTKVADFKGFEHGNDPYGEHDFGAFELEDELLFWKIDCYQKGSHYKLGAEHPEDAATTDRVLTIMLTEEY